MTTTNGRTDSARKERGVEAPALDCTTAHTTFPVDHTDGHTLEQPQSHMITLDHTRKRTNIRCTLLV
jgi:hypothetical protein